VRRELTLTLALVASGLARPVAARNPIVEDGLADPSVKVFGGRAYVYGTHDFSSSNGTWVAKDWHVYSSSDLVTWVDAGVALDDRALAWRRLSDQDWAADAAFFNNQYYFYFSLGDAANQVADAIGVATGSSPAGPFTDALGKALIDRSTAPVRGIDPMAFEDADGSRYLIWGNGGFSLAELNDDMKSFKTSPQPVTIAGAPSVEEGPFIWRRGGKYYLLYSRCGAGCRDSLDYGISDSVNGPYTYRGTIVAHGKQGNENGSVFELNGQWYVAYHDLAPTTYYRKTKLEFIHYTNSGDIPRVDPTVYGVGRYDGRAQIEAENYFDKSPGIAYEDCTDSGEGFAVTGITSDSWLKFQQVDFGAGADAFKARVSAGSGAIEIHLESATGPLIGSCDVPAGDPAWHTVNTQLSETISGVHDVVLVFRADAEQSFTINWLRFTGPGDTNDSGSSSCACTLNAGASHFAAPVSLLVMAAIVFRRRRQAQPRHRCDALVVR
jgi:hypothetical protein